MRERGMELRKSNRRAFIRDSFAVAATAALLEPGSVLFGRASAAEPKLQPIRLGGPSFAKTEDPEELALAHRKLGYRAAYCPGVALKDTDRIRALSEAFAKHDVVIAEVGRWCNLLDADPEKRRQNLETVTEGLALAEAIGARCCVDIAGSFSTTSWFGPHPDNLSPKLLRCRRGERAQDHRRGEAQARPVLLRDDGLGVAGQPGQLREAGQGGGPARVRRAPGPVQPGEFAGRSSTTTPPC